MNVIDINMISPIASHQVNTLNVMAIVAKTIETQLFLFTSSKHKIL